MALRKTRVGQRETTKPRPRRDSEVNAEEYDTVVFRNLSPSTDIVDIKHCLEKLGYKVLSIRNAYNQFTRIAYPIFFIKLYKTPFNANIFQLKYVAHQVVIVEEYLQGPDLPRCTRCQGLDHMKYDCINPAVCAWCSGSHYTTDCKVVNSSPPTCSRCGGCHPASYKGCRVYRLTSLMKAEENNKKNKIINSKHSSSEMSTSQANIKDEKKPITPTRNIITAANTMTSSITTISDNTVISASRSIDSVSSTISSDTISTPPCISLVETETASLSQVGNEKSEKASCPPGFSLPVLPIFDENAFKEQLRIVADVTDHFKSMNEDLYRKM